MRERSWRTFSASCQCWAEQSKRTLKWAEHRTDWHRPQVPTIFVFQSVCLSSNRHWSSPPFEIEAQGCLVPGMKTARHSCGNGTRQLRPVSPFSMEKLQDSSVVAPESSPSCAMVSRGSKSSIPSNTTRGPTAIRRIVIVADGSIVLYLAAMRRAA